MLANRSSQAPIESIAFLDIDRTLLLYIDQDGVPEQIYNQLVLNKLKKQNQYDVVLFSNMATSDIQYLNNAQYARCITREQLIHHLEQEGFRVHIVITPADPGYEMGPGAAYRDIYKKAYEKAQNEEDYQDECDEYKDCLSDLQVSNWVKCNYSRKAAQKYAMYAYFLRNLPEYMKNLKHIDYYDDDQTCLEAVYLANYHASSSIEVVPFLIDGMESIKKLDVIPKISKLAMTASDRIKPYSDGLVVGGATLLIYSLFALKYVSDTSSDSPNSTITPSNGL